MNRKLCIMGDTHFGLKNNSQNYLRYQLDYFENEVFPSLVKNNITAILHLGDFWNSRKELNINTVHWVKLRFLDKLKELGIRLYIVMGNHDSYFTYSNEITSLSILKEYDNIIIIDKPQVYNFGGDLDIGLVPWISNEEETKRFNEFIKNNTFNIIMGHFEIGDFEVVPGYNFEGGMKAEVFKDFEAVYTGHFHLKQTKGNIHFIGTPYEITWSDCNTEKGWYILHTKTREMEFQKNNNPVHLRLYYDEDFLDKSLQEIENIQGKIVKLFLIKKTNEAQFSDFVYKLEQKHPESFVIIENTDSPEVNLKNDEGKNTFDIVKDYLKDTKDDDEGLTKILHKLYTEVTLG